jgi:2,4-dienoyl-CoA reductase-like NADH-dependent reductase (Old Yellow Enzyme family)
MRGSADHSKAGLLLEVTGACVAIWGASRVGVHLLPRGDLHAMGDSGPAAIFGHVARELGKHGIAFICSREAPGDGRLGPALKAAFGDVYIANEKMNKTAEQLLAVGEAGAVAFGQMFIANPDLPRRLQLDALLNEPRPETFYNPGPEGHIDYPPLV